MGEKVPAPFYNRALAARRLICVQLHQIRPGGASAVGIACGRGTAPASSDGLVPGTEKKEKKTTYNEKGTQHQVVPFPNPIRVAGRVGSACMWCGSLPGCGAVASGRSCGPAQKVAGATNSFVLVGAVRHSFASTPCSVLASIPRHATRPTRCVDRLFAISR